MDAMRKPSVKIAIAPALLVLVSAATLSAQVAPTTNPEPAALASASRNPEPGTRNLNPEPGTPNPEPTDQATLAKIQSLYASAAYEDALAAMPAADAPATRDIEQYRALCLLALGRTEEVGTAVERLLARDPLFVPAREDTPPRLQAMYDDARIRIVPEVAKAMYAEAKAAWGRKDKEAAQTAFQKTLDVISSVPDPAALGLADLRELASGFLQLAGGGTGSPAPSTSSASRPAAAAPASDTVRTTPEGTTGTRPDVQWQGPVALRQDMPTWHAPTDSPTRRLEYRGLIRVTIDPAGQVADAKVVKASHPTYDVAVLRAAKRWSYQPATRNGLPVASEKEIEVVLRPQ